MRSEFELDERSCEARKRELGHPCPHEHELSSLREWERVLIDISQSVVLSVSFFLATLTFFVKRRLEVRDAPCPPMSLC